MRALSKLTFIATLALICANQLVCGQSSPDWTAREINLIASVVNDEDLCLELEIVKSQKSQLKEIANSFRLIHANYFLQSAKIQDNVEELKRKRQELLNKTVDQINSLFLPHQVDRLRQICHQTMYSARDFDFGLTKKNLSRKLEIDVQQAEEIKHRAALHKKDVLKRLEQFEKELLQIRREAKKDLFSVLTEDQQKQYQQIFGEIHFKKQIEFIK